MKRSAPLRRTPFRRRPAAARPTRDVTPRPLRRAGNIPTKVRAEVRARSGGYCEARIPACCTGAAEHMHHRLPRSRGGRHEASNLAHVCLPDHRWIHAHPELARALDLTR